MILMEKQGKVCKKCGEWKPLEEYHKNKNIKDRRSSQCKECAKRQSKQHYQNNKEHCKEQHKQHYQNNKEHCKEQMKQYSKQHYQTIKQSNLQYISSIVEQINPVFKQLNLPIYGYVYMFENIKTGHKYVGQSILPIARRYGSNVIKSWIEERLECDTQKFTEELIEEDFIVTETLDVAFCQYHLNVLEAYWINYYDSYNNGYNNTAGNHITDDGIEEFNRILLENGLEFIDNKLVENKKCLPK